MYTVEFKGQKSLSSVKKTITKTELKRFLIHLDIIGKFLSNYGETDFEGYNKVLQTALDAEWNYSNNDVDLICSISNSFGSRETVLKELYKVFGYDHIAVTAEWGNHDDIANGLFIATVNEAFNIIQVDSMN